MCVPGLIRNPAKSKSPRSGNLCTRPKHSTLWPKPPDYFAGCPCQLDFLRKQEPSPNKNETANVQLKNLCVDESDPPRDRAPLAGERGAVKPSLEEVLPQMPPFDR